MNICMRLLLLGSLLIPVAVPAQSNAPGSIDELLQQVRKAAEVSQEVNREREQRFLQDKKEAEKLLNQVSTELDKEKRLTAELKKTFDANQKELDKLQKELHARSGELGELFGVVRQMAGQASGQMEQSIITAQYPGRVRMMKDLAEQKALPAIPELEKLWLSMLQEMTESGKSVKYKTTVLTAEGNSVEQDVIRIGAFNTIGDGYYLGYLPENTQLLHLARQPSSSYLGMLEQYWQSTDNYERVPIDPSRGAILGILVQSPDWLERIGQGKLVGYIILLIGVAGLLLVGVRYLSLFNTEKRMQKQTGDKEARQDNPLGRVMAVYKNNVNTSLDALERKLDEAILKEAPGIDRGIAVIKIIAVIAPLLGLLGTVTGMIETFQSITLFGTGDPRLMAGGISQALVTTVLGLVVAIPLMFFHSVLNTKARRCINILEEQSAGFVAVQAERSRNE